MKILKKLMLVAFAGALFAACSKDLETADPVGPGAGSVVEGETVNMTFGLSLSDLTSPSVVMNPAQTRAADEESIEEGISVGDTPLTRADGTAEATEAEAAIKNLWVFQFNNAGNRVLAQLFKTEDIKNGKVSVPLYGFSNSTVYAVANVGEAAFADDSKKPATKTALEALKYSITSAVDIANGLPMIGSWSGSTLDTEAAGAAQPTIELKRLVAKINFELKTELSIATHTFTVKSVQLCSVSPETSYKEPTAAAPATTASFFNYAKGTDLKAEWYVPENLRGTITNSIPGHKSEATAPEKSTYIEVRGDYFDGVDVSEVRYRIYPGLNDTNDFNIKRNYIYTVTATIKGNNATDWRVIVATDLSVNPETKAFESANSYMISHAGYTYKFDATKQGNMASTAAFNSGTTTNQAAPAFSGTAIAPKSVKVLWEAKHGAEAVAKGDIIVDGSLRLEDGWVYFTAAGERGNAVTEGNAVIAAYDGENGTGNILWSWHIWSTGYNPNSNYFIYKTRALSASGDYAATASRTINVMIYNLGAKYASAARTVDRFGLLYQWGRKDPFVGSKATSGTAFVATTAAAPHNWPIVAASTAGANPAASITYAIQHPTTFITQINTTTYDWLNAPTYATQRDNLWGNPNATTKYPNPSSGSKSIYDPCPPGWRVAPQDTWTNFTTSGHNTSFNSTTNTWSDGRPNAAGASASSTAGFNVGWMFFYRDSDTATTDYYPATGYRNGTTGALDGVGTHVGFWSSSSYAAGNRHASFLRYWSGELGPMYEASRTNAFSVRCVQNNL